MSSPRVLILLPVYNGAPFLSGQLDSLLSQTHRNIMILCRDDASSDNSATILADYVNRYPGQVRVLDDVSDNLGASANYSLLMEAALVCCRAHKGSGNYIALSDQDDIWYPHKLERSLQALQIAESEFADRPVLVHGDLRVVDAGRREIAASFAQYQGLKPGRNSLPREWVNNTVTGCTILMNTLLLEKALPVPTEAIVHDWWLSLVVSAFGERVYLREPLLDYRQHAGNTIGAKSAARRLWSKDTLDKLLSSSVSVQNQEIFTAIARQTRFFVGRYGNQLTPLQRRLASAVCSLEKTGVWRRRILFRILRSM